jgi:hypothetical protein
VFSSHNRTYAHAATAPHLELSRNPISQLRCTVEYFRNTANHRRVRAFQRFEHDYALLNDSGYHYEALHYYISRGAQAQQLAHAGFELIECLDELGRTLRPEDDDTRYSSLHYIARPAA